MKPLYIMLHHSATKDGDTVSWGAIERYHRTVQGWRDIGYHAGVERVGIEYYAMYGRAEGAVAAACKEGGMNSSALHVCCVGNYDLDAPPTDMLKVLVLRILVPWMDRYGITAERIVGHRDYATYKTCPGSKFDIEVVRRMVR